jgi:tripartite-type tricarboxylate transporter receptor subunit TctC
MKLPRRNFLHLAAGAVALPAAVRIARAQAYPTRPVRWIVGFPPAGGADIVARLIGQSLSERLGQQFIIENRPGAAGNIATEAVVRAPADGYTLLMITVPNVVNATLYDKANYNFIRDIVPVANIDRVPNVMAINPSVPAKTVAEFIAYANANPGKINMASGGNGATYRGRAVQDDDRHQHAARALSWCGASAYRSARRPGPSHVRYGLRSVEHIKAGKLRALAVTTATRAQALPDVPTVADVVPGYEASTFHGVGAPRNTPPDIVNKLNREINAVLAEPGMQARLVELGAAVLPSSPADFGKFMAEETEKWAKVIKFAGIKAE